MLTKKGAPPLIQRVFHALFALRFRSAKAYALHKSIFMKQENVLMSFTYYPAVNEYMGRKTLQLTIVNYQ